MVKLYGSDLSPFAARCRIQLYAKGIDEIEYVGPPGGLASDEFKRLNPTGKIPALETGGRVLGESEVICEYIEDVWPEPSLRPADPMGRAQVRLLSRSTDLYVLTPLFSMLPHLNPKHRKESFVARQLAEMGKGLASLEANLTGGGYVDGDYAVGESLTLADCALVPMLLLIENTTPLLGVAEPFGKIPVLERYWHRVRRDDHCAKVVSEMAAMLTTAQKALAGS